MKRLQKIISILLLIFVGIGVAGVTNASNTYKDARKQYLKEKTFYKESRKQFLQEKKKFKEVKNTVDKSRYEKVAKAHLIKVIDILIAKLNRIEAWIDNRKALSDSEKSEIISEINKDKQWLEDKKSKVDGASKQEIRQHAKEVREYWKDSRVKVKRIIGKILAKRVEVAIDRAENTSEKLESAIKAAESNGKDVTNAKKLLVDLNAKIELAKVDAQNATNAFSNIASIQDADKFFREGNRYLKKVHTYLKEMHRIAKNITSQLRSS